MSFQDLALLNRFETLLFHRAFSQWSVPSNPDVRPADWTLHTNFAGSGTNAGPTVSIVSPADLALPLPAYVHVDGSQFVL